MQMFYSKKAQNGEEAVKPKWTFKKAVIKSSICNLQISLNRVLDNGVTRHNMDMKTTVLVDNY